MADRSVDSHLESFYEETANSPIAWYYCPETLFGTGEYVWAGLHNGPAAERLKSSGSMDTHYNSYGLLLGYALENVLKGIWLVRGGTFADVERPGRFVPIPGLKDHDLLALAKKWRWSSIPPKRRRVFPRRASCLRTRRPGSRVPA